MKQFILKSLDIVLRHTSPVAGWAEIVAQCKAEFPNLPWENLPTPDFERDIEAATLWLESRLTASPGAVGISLGLDTLDMGNCDGQNLEFFGGLEYDLAKEES